MASPVRGSAELRGGAELKRNLQALGKTTGKNVLRRVGRAMLAPMAEAARAGARRRSGDLADSIKVGTRLAPSQRGARASWTAAGLRSDPKNSVAVYMGPGQQPQAITEEFGKFNQAPHAFMRPAFDAHADPAIHMAGDMLWAEISRAAGRAAKKAAKAGKA